MTQPRGTMCVPGPRGSLWSALHPGGTSQQAGDSELTAIRNHVLMPENSGTDNINWFWFFQEEM